ncbi:MAG TPA: pantoate--beta-alanine ligase, partial [Planctomycetaceae bacterium]|nr:pantoate--beta-alanine ligase [Planctomycetaceae bacterium]
TEPDVAYFGQKDYQQQLLIRQMCRDLLLPVQVRVCPTVREPDGLAMSSRDAYLSPEERRSALSLSQALFLARDRLAEGECDLRAIRQAMRDQMESQPNVRVDYATICHPETLEELEEPLPRMVALVAARVNETRLIDNLLLET